jgi:mutual gliding-motility protein MglA
MSFINYSSREIILKIVYYGPGLCGKTTNIKFIYGGTNPDARGKLISLETKQERTLFFDFLPLALPPIHGFKTRLHLYTVPGQLFYSASRKLIMKGADGVVFVADSQEERLEANLISMEDLKENLVSYGYDIEKIPFVIQYNKRDLPTVLPVAELREQLNPWSPRVPDFEAVASAPQGPGVFDSLKAVVKMILIELKKTKS